MWDAGDVSDHRHVRTERLALDAITGADLEVMFELHADPDVWRHFPSGRHRDRDQTAGFIAESQREWAEGGLGYWVARLLADVEGGPAAGSVVGVGGCVRRFDLVWNVHYRLTPAAWGHGFATEIAAAGRVAASAVDPGAPVVAYLLEDNPRSRNTAERLGLTLAWRGPDHTNPDPAAVALIYGDRPLDESVIARLSKPS